MDDMIIIHQTLVCKSELSQVISRSNFYIWSYLVISFDSACFLKENKTKQTKL